MTFLGRIVCIFSIVFLPTYALGNGIDEYFYFSDDNTLSYRSSTLKTVGPGASELATIGTSDIAISMSNYLFCKNDPEDEDPEDPEGPACDVLSGTTDVRADIVTQVNLAFASIVSSGKASQVKAWIIIDEPYLDADGRRIPYNDLLIATDYVRWRSQLSPYNFSDSIPRWVNFAQDCFACSGARSSACMMPQATYCAIPGNLTWVGFDHYSADTQPDNCLNSTADCKSDDHMTSIVNPTLSRLKSHKAPYQDILLVPGTYPGNSFYVTPPLGTQRLSPTGANEVLARYVDLAANDNDVIGLVPFNYLTVIAPSVSPAWADSDQVEMFYQAIATTSINGLKDLTWKPVFEYNDDLEFTKSGALSPADSHYYTLGYEGTSTGVYAVRRLAFYMKASQTAKYSSKIYRCKITKSSGRFVVFFTGNSNCDGVTVAVVDGTGYISPVATTEADHRIINCRSPALPYYDQGWTLAASGETPATVCANVFGSQYAHFSTIGYSKKY